MKLQGAKSPTAGQLWREYSVQCSACLRVEQLRERMKTPAICAARARGWAFAAETWWLCPACRGRLATEGEGAP